MAETHPRFLPGVPEQEIISLLSAAPGNELDSGKFDSPNSSSALAVNTFGWFLNRPEDLPPFRPDGAFGIAKSVSVESEMRFPWKGGKHPWLDAAIWTDSHLIGVESKRYEPFRSRKQVKLSTAYDRPVWGEKMKPYEEIRDSLRAGELEYKYLDATQLVKHAFGLVTQASKHGLEPILVYLYAEPHTLDGKQIVTEKLEAHRHEIDDFTDRTADAEVSFLGLSYKDWLDTWAHHGVELQQHSVNIQTRYDIAREG